MGGIEFLGEIYRGARFVLFRGWQRADGTAVVVKAVRADIPDADDAAARLGHEHDLLRSIEIPGVVRLLGVEQMGERPALILTDAGSQTLKDWLRRRSLPPERFLALALDLTEIVTRLHDRGIIHRDLTPWNIVIDDDERLTLIDFDRATRITGLPEHAGVPSQLDDVLPYLAPEETGRLGRLVDHRADLYALGAIFYELLTGAPPFATNDPLELAHAQLARAPLPPSEANPAVPPLLSALVLRLLAKTPEGRYQRAEALLADLREAKAQRDSTGTIDLFELGVIDLDRELSLTETLYQREREQSLLTDAWGRAAGGATAAMLLSGAAGTGKTALASDLRERVVARGGRCAAGKFEQRPGSGAHVAIASALRSLASGLLAEPEDVTARTMRRVLEAIGPNAGVLTELCPELERLLGESAPLPPLGPVESENRFQLAITTFLRALATREHPLLLLLDDLQWTDAASARLLATINRAELPYLMILTAFRADDLPADSPAHEALASLRAPGSRVLRELELAPLDLEAVTALCCDVLRCPPEQGRALAELVVRKTAGNPLFVRRLLRHLHQTGLLIFDRVAGAWSWDLAALAQVQVAENVVNLLVAGVERLPTEAQEVMELAACIGQHIPLALVARLRGRSIHATAAALSTAVQQGFLVPGEPDPGPEGPSEGAIFQFVHDRVQEAAYSRISPERRPVLHLAIGRALLATGDPGAAARDRWLFATVDQLHRGSSLLTEPRERVQLAELDLRAAERARAASAFTAALEYLERGLALLPAAAAAPHHDLEIALARRAIECAYLVGDVEKADRLLATALPPTVSGQERLKVYQIQVDAALARGAYADAFDAAHRGLELLGIRLPDNDGAAASAAELAAVDASLGGRRVEDLLEDPAMQDQELLDCMRLMAAALPIFYILHQDLYPLVVGRMVNLSLRHGQSVHSSMGYACYAVLVHRRTGDFTISEAFGRLGVAIARRFGSATDECRALTVFATQASLWSEPIGTSVHLLREGVARGLQAGNLLFAGGAAGTVPLHLYHLGIELPRVLSEIKVAETFCRRIGQSSNLEALSTYRQAIRCLRGLTAGRNRFTDDPNGSDEDELRRSSGSPVHFFIYYVRRLETSYLLRDFDTALAMSERGGAYFDFERSALSQVEHDYYTALTACALGTTATEGSTPFTGAAHNRQRLAALAVQSPGNYQHKHLLVSAEVARLEGRALEAAELYGRAIEVAEHEPFLQDLALANELAGRFHRREGRRRFSRLYLQAAIDGFSRWGASAKVEALLEEFPDLESQRTPRPAGFGPGAASLDLLSLFRAAEAISSEVMFERLLDRLMEACLSTAGAERGALVLTEGGRLVVRALGEIGEPTMAMRTALDQIPQVAQTLIEKVQRTEEPLVIADAAREPGLAHDPRLSSGEVHSLLVLPVLRQGRLVGVLYLENNLAPRVFSPDRVRLVQLLSSQIAASIENSLLFEQLTHEVDERKRAEAAVRFLAESGAALAESLEYQATLAKVARLSVESLADLCIIDVIEAGVLRRVAAAHRDPAKEELLLDFRRLQDRAGPPRTHRVLESGEAMLFEELSSEGVGAFVEDPAAIRLLALIGASSAMALPLRARGVDLGVLTLVSGTPKHRFQLSDLQLASELARRAALAIDNARLYREAQEAVRLRDDFLSIASHELNTPITSLQFAVQGLDDGVGDAEQVRKSVQIILRQTRRLDLLITELMDVARIQTGQLHLRLERLDLKALVADIIERFEPELTQAHCPVELHAERAVFGDWDRARLEQVVSNLLSNAVKFSRGQLTEIIVTEDAGGRLARLVVLDHGIGIPHERLPHIFERFERAVPGSTYEGLGLGLYIARQIVDALGGRIFASSEVGIGSRFTVELPIRPRTPDRVSPHEEHAPE